MSFFSNSNNNNKEFLPAALEILERPPSPLGRILAIAIGSFFLLLIFWSTFGKVDVIVTGQGKIIPSGQVKTIQPFESGVVTAINVVDGQHVEKGQVLVELDPTDTSANVQNLKSQLHTALLDNAVAKALIAGTPYDLAFYQEDLSESQILEAQSQVEAMYNSYQSSLRELDAQEIRLQSELSTNAVNMQKMSELIPILEKRTKNSGTLLSQDRVRSDDRLALAQQLVETSAQIDALEQTNNQIIATIEQVKATREKAMADFESQQLTRIRETRSNIDELQFKLSAESQRDEYRKLIAPVSGFVDQLTVHTLGGVVQPGEVVMNIVPDLEKKEIEAYVLNKDIGFIEVGDPVEIKLEAFPFTRYGVLDGRLTKISNDAVAQEGLGLVYKVNALIETNQKAIEESGIVVGAGMNTTIEIQSDRRRVISYFISPVLRYKDEAIRER